VIAPDDCFDLHIEDSLKAGAGLCHPNIVERVVRDAPARIQELINWGSQFSKTKDQNGLETLSLEREGGHSRHRIVYTEDLTGHTFMADYHDLKDQILSNRNGYYGIQAGHTQASRTSS
jgi:aspartate oxidase